MRRALIGLAMTAVTVLALAGQAGAASGRVTHFRFSGTFANAFWGSSTGIVGTALVVSKSSQGSALFVDQFTLNYDANGNVTGATDTSASVTSGFSFAVHRPLASAGLSASGLPARTCTFDADLGLIGCSATTIDLTAAWTGQGPITRSVDNIHSKAGGFNVTEHFNGTSRAAAATGTVAGLTLSESNPEFTDLGTTKSGTTTVCIGTSC